MILLNTGIYTVPEASRLSEVAPSRIRRWMSGYRCKGKTYERYWVGQLPKMEGKQAVGFLDLIELRFMHFFLAQGVSLQRIKQVHQALQHRHGISHPFSTGQYGTDRVNILEQAADELGERLWVNVTSGQAELKFVEQFIHQLDFGSDSLAARWWPRGRDNLVVLDPQRNFGKPMLASCGVPTRAIITALRANDTVEAVAEWYEVSIAEVQAALEFERSLAA
ncbi:MAG: DUF433 domain-containing protein [Verrucomicrobiota bacterium JB022]|nr:DUF433 domain-containing protein [Verrucomicrobiota bacterium JB022]